MKEVSEMPDYELLERVLRKFGHEHDFVMDTTLPRPKEYHKLVGEPIYHKTFGLDLMTRIYKSDTGAVCIETYKMKNV